MTVHFKSSSGVNFSLRLAADASVAEAKRAVGEWLGVGVIGLHLVWAGASLDDAHLLRAHRIVDGSTVHVLGRWRGD